MIEISDAMVGMASADLSFILSGLENARNADLMDSVIDFLMNSPSIDEVFVTDDEIITFITGIMHRSKLMWMVN